MSNPFKANCLLVALDVKPAYWSRTGVSSEELNMLREIAKNLGLRFVSYENGGHQCFVYNPRGLAKVFLQNRTELLNPASYIAEKVKLEDFIRLLENINFQAIIDAGDFSEAEPDIAQLDKYLVDVGRKEKDKKPEAEVFPIGLAMGYGPENARMFLKYQKIGRTISLYPFTSARHNIWFTAVDKEAGQRLLDGWVEAADIAVAVIAGATVAKDRKRLTKKEIRDRAPDKSNDRAERIKRSNEKYRGLVLLTAWQRLKEGDSQLAEEILGLLPPRDRVGLPDLALMFDGKVDMKKNAPALTELSHGVSELASPQLRSLNVVKNRIIALFLDFINRYGLYRIAAYPEFLVAVLFSVLNPLALPFIVAGGMVAQSNSPDEEWVKALLINVLTFGAEHIIDAPAVKNKISERKIRDMIADFKLNAEDIRLINDGRKELGLEKLSGQEVQAELENFRRLYDLGSEYVIKGEAGRQRTERRNLARGDDETSQGDKKRPSQRNQGRGAEDLEGRLLSDSGNFWGDLSVTWGQKLACLRQVINERGLSVGLGVTIPVLDDEKIQELITLISREPKESLLHELAGAILREKERQKAQQGNRIAAIKGNIAEAGRLLSEGELQAAMEKIEETLSLAPDDQEALSLKGILAQESENRKRQADIENRLKAGLKTLYENKIRLRDKKITKEERASLESAAKDARSLIRTLSEKYASVYLSVLKGYEGETRFYEEMLEILIQRVFELESGMTVSVLGAIYTASPRTMAYFWQNKSRLKNNPGFRKILLGFMLSHPEADIATLNSYLRLERDFIVDSVLEQKEGEDDYMGFLLKLMAREKLYAGEDKEAKAREEFKSETLEITRIIINRDINKLNNVLELLLNGVDFDIGEQILGYLFLKIDNLSKKFLDILSEEEEVFVFSEILLKSISFHEKHSRQDISNAMEASLVRILEEAADIIYEKSSFELPRNVSLLIEYLQNKGELSESVFSVRTELTSYLEENDYDRLAEKLKRENISYKERLAILYRIAILWTHMLKGSGDLGEIEAMCQERDPLIRAYFYYALALVRGSSKNKRTIADKIMKSELRRIVERIVSSGRLNRDVLMNILYELKLGDSRNKLFMAYGVLASLGIERNISIEIQGENLSSKILEADNTSLIKEALSEAARNDWIINNAEDKEIIEDIIWLLSQPEDIKRRAFGSIIILLSGSKGNADMLRDYRKIISNAKQLFAPSLSRQSL